MPIELLLSIVGVFACVALITGLATTLKDCSAQQLVTEALDRFLEAPAR